MSRTLQDVRDRLAELADQLGHESCLEFLTIVQQSLPAQAADLSDAIRNENNVLAARAAHKLRGSVGSLGASEFGERLLDLEQRLASNDLAAASSLETDLTSSIQELLTILAVFIEEHRAPPPTA